MTDEVHHRLSAALRAQASGLGAASPARSASDYRSTPTGSPGRESAHTKPRLPARTVLILAVLLGAMAGALAGLISAW